jgi:hypothetical protein
MATVSPPIITATALPAFDLGTSDVAHAAKDAVGDGHHDTRQQQSDVAGCDRGQQIAGREYRHERNRQAAPGKRASQGGKDWRAKSDRQSVEAHEEARCRNRYVQIVCDARNKTNNDELGRADREGRNSESIESKRHRACFRSASGDQLDDRLVGTGQPRFARLSAM